MQYAQSKIQIFYLDLQHLQDPSAYSSAPLSTWPSLHCLGVFAQAITSSSFFSHQVNSCPSIRSQFWSDLFHNSFTGLWWVKSPGPRLPGHCGPLTALGPVFTRICVTWLAHAHLQVSSDLQFHGGSDLRLDWAGSSPGMVSSPSWLECAVRQGAPTGKIRLCYAVLSCSVIQLHPTLCDPMDCSPPGSSVHGDSPGKNTGVGCHALLQDIFPTQGLNPCLLHCR